MITAKVTIEGGDLISPDLEKLIMDAMNTTIAETLKDFNATKATFSGRSQFDFDVQKATKKGNTIEGSVGTDNPNYCRINFGTGQRPRTARSAKGMSFRTGYRAKTRRGHVGSGSSARTGKWVSGAQHVVSGAIRARNFDETILKSREPDFVKNIDKALELATK